MSAAALLVSGAKKKTVVNEALATSARWDRLKKASMTRMGTMHLHPPERTWGRSHAATKKSGSASQAAWKQLILSQAEVRAD